MEPKIKLGDIADNLWQLCVTMEKDNPTNVCFGYDPFHLSNKTKIMMATEYIKRTIKHYKN